MTRSLEALKRKLPVNWMFGWTHNTLVPHAKLMRSIELFTPRCCRGWAEGAPVPPEGEAELPVPWGTAQARRSP